MGLHSLLLSTDGYLQPALPHIGMRIVASWVDTSCLVAYDNNAL